MSIVFKKRKTKRCPYFAPQCGASKGAPPLIKDPIPPTYVGGLPLKQGKRFLFVFFFFRKKHKNKTPLLFKERWSRRTVGTGEVFG